MSVIQSTTIKKRDGNACARHTAKSGIITIVATIEGDDA
jgi:hypothetical protein